MVNGDGAQSSVMICDGQSTFSILMQQLRPQDMLSCGVHPGDGIHDACKFAHGPSDVVADSDFAKAGAEATNARHYQLR